MATQTNHSFLAKINEHEVLYIVRLAHNQFHAYNAKET